MPHHDKTIGKSIPKYFGASFVVGNIILIKEINRPDFLGGFFLCPKLVLIILVGGSV